MNPLKQFLTKDLYDVDYVKNYSLKGKGIGLKYAIYLSLLVIAINWTSFILSSYVLVKNVILSENTDGFFKNKSEFLIKNYELDPNAEYTEVKYPNDKKKILFIINPKIEDILKEEKKSAIYFGKKQMYITIYNESYDYEYETIFANKKAIPVNLQSFYDINLSNKSDFSKIISKTMAHHIFILILFTIPIFVIKFAETILGFFIMYIFAKGLNKSAKELGKKEYKRMIAITYFIYQSIILIIVSLPFGLPNSLYLIVFILAIIQINKYDFSKWKEKEDNVQNMDSTIKEQL